MSCSASDRARAHKARYKAEGRCQCCGLSIGTPPQPTHCEVCRARKNAKQGQDYRLRKGIVPAVPTFDDFEREERRRGRR